MSPKARGWRGPGGPGRGPSAARGRCVAVQPGAEIDRAEACGARRDELLVAEHGPEVGRLVVRDDASVVLGRGEVPPDEVVDRNRVGAGDLDGAVRRRVSATSATAAATSSAAMGCMGADDSRTVSPSALDPAMAPMNSKNCVARTIVYGTPAALIRSSCATFARMYPLSGSRSAPTTDRATWCPTPAAALGRQQVARRRLEELHHGGVLEGWRVRHVDDDVGAGQRFGEPLARDGVDAGSRRGRHHLVALCAERRHDLRADEPATADNHDLHRHYPFATNSDNFCPRHYSDTSYPSQVGWGA